ncbi:MAG: nicotinate-nucleotide adenylyltransferase [Candidatus Eremiobacteraeota bacterium]|nr:nicotinate-nucleotide adenylyltransferase [Candidatus Eremiobacteraeota bacterium]
MPLGGPDVLSGAAAARVGVFGGSFDPPHMGHLLVASDAVDALALDRVLFVPTATQPLKHRGRAAAPAAARVAMVRALVGDDARFAVEPLEIERGGLSYTVDTLDMLVARAPGAQWFLLVGTDVLSTFDRWRDPLRVRALATLVVLAREVDGTDARAIPARFPGGLPQLLPTRRIDLSSTEVRARVGAGRSIHGFVPDAVAAIIREARLYQE